ncbi:OLC1v1019438C1 [Oldenlandia corymbosa var. corymbosa]|uniref:OLC1v1019438C1 n=1 Tax=Oldenlandia corymbosa var. corymbosa TaxID=529605 RepID=A0AAV1EEE9_OLDCO|nr:OLC1v1019438C1 [Oldenlandia corymbosa var. corymbosa]
MGGFDDRVAIIGDWMPPSPSPGSLFSSMLGDDGTSRSVLDPMAGGFQSGFSFPGSLDNHASTNSSQKDDGVSIRQTDVQSHSSDTPAKAARRQLREKRREKHAADLVKQDKEVTLKLENAAIERSKSVDSAVLGKYSIWRKENDMENTDSTVRLIRDQMIMARVYISLATMKNKLDLARELQN